MEGWIRRSRQAGREVNWAGGRSLAVLTALLAISIFLLDYAFPVGVAAGVPYVAVMLLSLWGFNRRQRYLLGVAITVLTIVGFLVPLPHGSAAFWIGLENRFIALFAIWATVILGDVVVLRSEELREREARLSAVFSAAVDAVLIIDERGVIDSCNRAALELLGYEEDELLGQHIDILKLDRQGETDSIEGLAAAVWQEQETRAVRRDGTSYWAEITANAVYFGSQRLFALVLRDITERKQTQQRQLQTERLAAIGEAMTGLAHESRNALQRSQACIELLGDCLGDNAEGRDLLADIQKANDELHRLYEEVREYASPLRLTSDPCCMGPIAEHAWQWLHRTWAERAVKLVVAGDAADVPIEADAFAMRRLFRNAFENSLAACPDPVIINVHIALVTWNAQPALQIRIRDNGPGICAEIAQHVFEPFFTTKTRGTGLGLAICRRIALAHGGEIAVADSRQGAEIAVYLPGVCNDADATHHSGRRRTADVAVLSESAV